jgi:hypothetical protein
MQIQPSEFREIEDIGVGVSASCSPESVRGAKDLKPESG